MSKNRKEESNVSDSDDEYTAAELLLEKAQKFKNAGRYEDAFELLNRVHIMQENRKPESYWKDKGLGKLQKGKYEAAIKCFDNDLEMNRKSFDAYFSKGVTLYALGSYVEAVECFQNAYEIKFVEGLKHANKIDLFKTYRKFEDAVKYSKAIGTEQVGYTFWYYMGLAMYALKRNTEAADCLKSALVLEPRDSAILYSLAKCELLSNNIEKCIDLLEDACNLDPSNKRLLRVDPAFDRLRNDETFRILLGYGTSTT